MSKLTFACYLFLFRHGLHGKHRFSLFFSVKSAKSVPKRNHQMYFDTLSFLFMKKTMCTLSDAYDKRTEEWKREVFRIRGSLLHVFPGATPAAQRRTLALQSRTLATWSRTLATQSILEWTEEDSGYERRFFCCRCGWNVPGCRGEVSSRPVLPTPRQSALPVRACMSSILTKVLRQAVLPAGSDRGLSIGSVYGKPLAGTTPDSKAVQVPCVRMCVF